MGSDAQIDAQQNANAGGSQNQQQQHTGQQNAYGAQHSIYAGYPYSSYPSPQPIPAAAAYGAPGAGAPYGASAMTAPAAGMGGQDQMLQMILMMNMMQKQQMLLPMMLMMNGGMGGGAGGMGGNNNMMMMY